MKTFFLFIVGLACIVCPQTLTLNSPKNGDVFRVYDTMTVMYDADSAYMFGGKATGVVVWISVNGNPYGQLKPVEINNGYNTIPLNDPFWGKAPVVIPDTVYVIKSNGAEEAIYTVADSVLLKVMDYAHYSIKTTSNVIKVLAPLNAGIIQVARKPNQNPGRMVFIRNGMLTSSAAIASVSLFNVNGRRIANYEHIDIKETAPAGRLARGAYIAVCRFVGSNETKVVKIIGW